MQMHTWQRATLGAKLPPQQRFRQHVHLCPDLFRQGRKCHVVIGAYHQMPNELLYACAVNWPTLIVVERGGEFGGAVEAAHAALCRRD